MPRAFASVWVSTTGRTTETQIKEIEAAGFQVEPRRIVAETVSGSTAIAQRRGFSKLLDQLGCGVKTTGHRLAKMGVRVSCRALGGADLTSSAR